ncbi:RNA polymerase sigma factor [Dyadobacter jiangsuensis]|uniref:RNA polymerase sigma-70 factor (ECF subfamily) n=1 Tax=Dyadobacter jiangsuensis TaxID=1591085 RepID=A0A2P8G1U6_9BACT|nr:RNA polymerase sigma-70 factor [Dyadobacter jiangsuensis]PSL27921.1 RNA polymerase sigma-70 factor (ECF subfamily) [Dyadobacter jiangsuensis]
MDALEETVLLKDLASGDSKAFDEVYHYYRGEINRYVFKFVKSTEHTEDLCQEIFLKVWEKRETLANLHSFRAYLFTVSKNRVLDFLRHAATERSVREEVIRASLQHASHVEEALQSEEYQHYLQKILHQLSPRDQEVFRLCREMEHSYDEAAEVLGVSRNAIKKHMVKAIKFLKYSAHKSFGLSFNSIVVCVMVVW